MNSYGKFPFGIGKSTVHEPFSIAMEQIIRGYMMGKIIIPVFKINPVCYWKWPIEIVDLAIEHGDCP